MLVEIQLIENQRAWIYLHMILLAIRISDDRVSIRYANDKELIVELQEWNRIHSILTHMMN